MLDEDWPDFVLKEVNVSEPIRRPRTGSTESQQSASQHNCRQQWIQSAKHAGQNKTRAAAVQLIEQVC